MTYQQIVAQSLDATLADLDPKIAAQNDAELARFCIRPKGREGAQDIISAHATAMSGLVVRINQASPNYSAPRRR